MRIPRFKYIILYSLLIVLLGIIISAGTIYFLGIKFNSPKIIQTSAPTVEANIITLLSIIVTLGVAYSFYSIYNVTNEFESLKAKNKSTENKIEDESKSLAERSIALDRKIELYRLNSKADTDFRNRRFLRALKNEIEILQFILQNEKYLNGTLLNSTNEFRSSIGIKRSFIANNILKCMEHLTNDKVSKFKGKELSDTIESIHFAEHTIKYRDGLWSLIPKAEQERYSFLFKTVEQLLEIFWKYQKSSTKYAYNQLIINLPTFIEEQIGNKNGN